MARPSASTALTLGVLGVAAGAAVVLGRPERVPASLEAPPRASVRPRVQPAGDANEPIAAESDPADEPPRGYALTRQDLEGGLLKVRARAMACRSELPPPVVPLKIVIAPNGQVTQVALPEELRATAAGQCIVRAIRMASFPAWTAPPVPSVEWSYPLRFDGD